MTEIQIKAKTNEEKIIDLLGEIKRELKIISQLNYKILEEAKK
jgi:hypothetical protein